MTESTSNQIAMIEADGLSKFYGPFAAARGISFSGQQRRIGRIFGTEWCGKKHDNEDAHRLSVTE